jgi:hypothetical protein
MIVSSFIIQANVITIVNYNRQTFIVQATGLTFWIRQGATLAWSPSWGSTQVESHLVHKNYSMVEVIDSDKR